MTFSSFTHYGTPEYENHEIRSLYMIFPAFTHYGIPEYEHTEIRSYYMTLPAFTPYLTRDKIEPQSCDKTKGTGRVAGEAYFRRKQ